MSFNEGLEHSVSPRSGQIVSQKGTKNCEERWHFSFHVILNAQKSARLKATCLAKKGNFTDAQEEEKLKDEMHHKKKDMPLKGIKSVTDLQQCLQFYMYRACVNEPMRSRLYPVYINMRTKERKQKGK